MNFKNMTKCEKIQKILKEKMRKFKVLKLKLGSSGKAVRNPTSRRHRIFRSAQERHAKALPTNDKK